MLQMEDFQKLGVSLDLAVEANQLLRGKANIEVAGVKEQVLNYDNSAVTIIDRQIHHHRKPLSRLGTRHPGGDEPYFRPTL